MTRPFLTLSFFAFLAASAGCHLLNGLNDNTYGSGGSGAQGGDGAGGTTTTTNSGGSGAAGGGGMGMCAEECDECYFCSPSTNECELNPGQACDSVTGGACDTAGTCVNGQAQWVRYYASNGTEQASAVAIDSTNRIIIGGDVSGTTGLSFGSDMVGSINLNESDVFIAALNPDTGAGIEALDSGNQANQTVLSLATSGTHVFASGVFEGTVFDAPMTMDNDGFVISANETLTSFNGPNWEAYLTGTGEQRVNALGSSSNLVVAAGSFVGTLFMPAPLTNLTSGSMEADAMVIGYAAISQFSPPLAEPLWTADFNGNSDANVSVNGVAINGNDVFITGSYEDAPTFMMQPPLTDAGIDDKRTFVAKLSTSGAFAWIRTFGSMVGNQVATDVAVDGDEVVIVGHYEGSMLDDDGMPVGTIEANPGMPDVFVIKLDTDGNVRWGAAHPSEGAAHAHAVAVDANRNIILVGDFETGITCGATPHTCHGTGTDAFVFKLTRDGERIWTYTAGAMDSDDAFHDVVIDASGNVVVVGEASGELAETGLAGMGSMDTPGGGADVWVAKLSP